MGTRGSINRWELPIYFPRAVPLRRQVTLQGICHHFQGLLCCCCYCRNGYYRQQNPFSPPEGSSLQPTLVEGQSGHGRRAGAQGFCLPCPFARLSGGGPEIESQSHGDPVAAKVSCRAEGSISAHSGSQGSSKMPARAGPSHLTNPLGIRQPPRVLSSVSLVWFPHYSLTLSLANPL